MSLSNAWWKFYLWSGSSQEKTPSLRMFNSLALFGKKSARSVARMQCLMLPKTWRYSSGLSFANMLWFSCRKEATIFMSKCTAANQRTLREPCTNCAINFGSLIWCPRPPKFAFHLKCIFKRQRATTHCRGNFAARKARTTNCGSYSSVEINWHHFKSIISDPFSLKRGF